MHGQGNIKLVIEHAPYVCILGLQLKTEPRLAASLMALLFRIQYNLPNVRLGVRYDLQLSDKLIRRK
jgi:hypothetical protein